MIHLTILPRRAVLAAQAAIAGLTALAPGLSRAAATVHSAPGDATTAATETASAAPAPARWPTATATELRAHLGQRFRLTLPDGRTIAMRLDRLMAPSVPDTHRPANLPRRSPVTAVFVTPDAAPLAQDRDGLCTVTHPTIGRAQVFASATPRDAGGYVVDIILN